MRHGPGGLPSGSRTLACQSWSRPTALPPERVLLSRRLSNRRAPPFTISWKFAPWAMPVRRLVIEEFMTGEEASFLVFADGTAFHPMVVSQDHKRRFDGDQGPNTGGMGAYSIDTILTPAQHDAVLSSIIRPTLAAAKDYTGILYAGLMLTPDGPKVIEYNARFGDPETQVILPRLKTDLLEVFMDMADHRLDSRRVEWSSEVTATVVLVASGYPGKFENGKRIEGLDEAGRLEGVRIYHAGTREQDGKIYTAGGRILNVTARGKTLVSGSGPGLRRGGNDKIRRQRLS